MKKKHVVNTGEAQDEKKDGPDYVSPKITSYTNEEIMDQIGPAQAGTSGPEP